MSPCFDRPSHASSDAQLVSLLHVQLANLKQVTLATCLSIPCPASLPSFRSSLHATYLAAAGIPGLQRSPALHPGPTFRMLFHAGCRLQVLQDYNATLYSEGVTPADDSALVAVMTSGSQGTNGIPASVSATASRSTALTWVSR
jgi:hypothetical protein